ncbi:Gibberellin 20 oxidase 2 [Seminavis robusta]|uniref:Gibberellin 20 oxidase 2 n=1 Tax=Seminavis robusta TaxID=568900 RepID=A0A9N8HV05_9STRA|nr:Gibberellin 20 oxidase 2 [Seminavis robusta]|eukprot:Sro2209_g319160.1 Gibberellin 20 oxidase 2 (323) ;mRNA; f:4686-5654
MESSPFEVAPLITLSSEVWLVDSGKSSHQQQQEIGKEVVSALQRSGFLLIQSDIMPRELQNQALQDATSWLTGSSSNPLVTTHPTDPKSYVMLDAKHKQDDELALLQPYFTPALMEYWNACEKLKMCVLRAIGVGLQVLENPEDLSAWHSQSEHSAMRLLYYPPATATTGNRCKAHSDYGSCTLLSTDGVSGLEILLDGKWWPVPHVPGAMVVNIGSLLSEWTTTTSAHDDKNNVPPLLATLHRVAGPASENSASDPSVLRQAMAQGRTSIAFFADPDNDTPLAQKGTSIEDYIAWRSGGSHEDRSGIAFTAAEQDLMRPEK